MSMIGRMFTRKQGGTLVGNMLRHTVRNAVLNLSQGLVNTDSLGITDGHLNGGINSENDDLVDAVQKQFR